MNTKNSKFSIVTRTIKLSRQAFGKYKLQIFILTILGFLSGFLEGIGVNALIPLFSFVIGNGEGGDDIVSRSIEKIFLFFNINFNLKFILIFICLVFVLKAVVLFIFGYIKIKIVADYDEQTRNGLFQHTLKSRWTYLLCQKIGHLETIIMINTRQTAMLLNRISIAIMMITGLLMYTIIALNISLHITIITLVLGVTLFIFLKPLARKTRMVAQKIEATNKQIAHHINENMLGMKTIKAMNAWDSVIKISKENFSKLKNLKIRIALLSVTSNHLIQPISLIFICVVFALSYKTPNFSFAALVAVVYLIQKIFLYIQQMHGQLLGINEELPYLRSVLGYQEMTQKNKERNYGTKLFNLNNSLSFKNVSFSYNNVPILKEINFSIKKGEMVGLIGASGAGKTTVVDLILRLLIPDKGSIMLDGLNSSEIDMKEWRNSIGYVSQDIFLKNDSIANNIKFYNDSISDEDVITAAKMANIYDFVQTCPNKFSTIIGERGMRLSAGQRQRVVIARILAKKSKLLIFDEATSALDNESEVKIQKIINNIKGSVTVLVIAHRLSTIINSDKLLVLADGKIIERGTPEELLKNEASYFYRVYNIRE